ncbi:hypothetical protein EXIGLDRAFT_754753 [Exidia glandulosa HHB12029]|uniref:Uncharacterized protein n=1 Tax=Exidia glandulosa HHB12029 TaxID=1314781 RepID=A0A165CMA9_EXIGL|nr:hypothetical protein EXIGLDRAFT_754753 [Exidia glandulosa HHB12029]
MAQAQSSSQPPTTQRTQPRARTRQYPANAWIVYAAPHPLPDDCKNGMWMSAPWRIGGHVLTYDQVEDWARRLGSKIPDDRMAAWFKVDAFARCSGKFRVMPSCDGSEGSDKLWYGDMILISRLASFPRGYIGMAESKVPQFEFNANDQAAKDFLESQGITDAPYVTRLSQVNPARG